MKFSVIIPVYNAEKDLEKCLDSILVQTYKDFELLLVDDGSKDGSGMICDKYASIDKRIKVFHKANEGASATRNYGIDQACGEYIVFIDADDYVSSDYLEQFAKYDADCIICGAQKFGLSNSMEILSQNKYEGIENITNFINKNIYKNVIRTPWAKAVKSEVISNKYIKFNPKVKLGEDTLFVIECYLHCNAIQTIDKVGYHYRDEINMCSKYKLSLEEYMLFLKEIAKIKDSYRSVNIDISRSVRAIVSIIKIVYLNSLITKHIFNEIVESVEYIKNEVYNYECHENMYRKLRAIVEIGILPYRRWIHENIISKFK